MRIIALVTPIANILIGQSCQPIKDKRFCNTQNFNFEIDLTIVFVTSTFGGSLWYPSNILFLNFPMDENYDDLHYLDEFRVQPKQRLSHSMGTC